MWQNTQSQSPSRVEECDVRKAWTDTLSNKDLHQLKQECEGAKKRNSLMYYILWAARWKKYTYYTWPRTHKSRWQWSWWGTQLKVCLKRARIPLQLHHNAQGHTEGIAVDLGRLFNMSASPQLISSSQTRNLVSHYLLHHHPKQMTTSSANATHQTLTPTSAWSVQQMPLSYYRWLKLVLLCFKLVDYIYYTVFYNTSCHFSDAKEPNTGAYSSLKCTFTIICT
jgi:hypothetical protein